MDTYYVEQNAGDLIGPQFSNRSNKWINGMVFRTEANLNTGQVSDKRCVFARVEKFMPNGDAVWNPMLKMYLINAGDKNLIHRNCFEGPALYKMFHRITKKGKIVETVESNIFMEKGQLHNLYGPSQTVKDVSKDHYTSAYFHVRGVKVSGAYLYKYVNKLQVMCEVDQKKHAIKHNS